MEVKFRAEKKTTVVDYDVLSCDFNFEISLSGVSIRIQNDQMEETSQPWNSTPGKSRNWMCHVKSTIFGICIFSCLLPCIAIGSIYTDLDSLVAFKASADKGGILNRSWVGRTSNPCGNETSDPWLGIKCNNRGRVVQVSLTNFGLSGAFLANTLSRLNDLRNLVLTNNSFEGSIPDDLSEVNGLLQFWAHNAGFSGPFPNFLRGSRKLVKVDLSGNDFMGPIPDLSELKTIMFLNLSGNSLSGSIPPFPPNLTVLDLSYNLLSGRIPSALANNFTSSSFVGNADLCGLPVSKGCPPVSPGSSNGTPLYPGPASSIAGGPRPTHRRLSKTNMVLIVIGDCLAMIFIILALAICYHRKYRKEINKKMARKMSNNSIEFENQHHQLALTSSLAFPEPERSKLVFFEEEYCRYDLEDLLRASAEMLGKGSFGTMYKAVLENGSTVGVKRLKHTKEMAKEEFDADMLPLGKARHPNLVALRAFYYAREEKLLVYDFMPNGSLFAMLHGNRGLGPSPLEWCSRLRIAEGIVSGILYLHRGGAQEECRKEGSMQITRSEHEVLLHGNLKSSNILLGKNLDVQISEFGLYTCMDAEMAAQRMEGYRAPESSHFRQLTVKADVFCFGLLLLELVTGRQSTNEDQEGKKEHPLHLPQWVQAAIKANSIEDILDEELRNPSTATRNPNRDDPSAHADSSSYPYAPSGIERQQMLDLLNIAIACLTPDPDFRPDMASVAAQIRAIQPTAPGQPPGPEATTPAACGDDPTTAPRLEPARGTGLVPVSDHPSSSSTELEVEPASSTEDSFKLADDVSS